MVTFVHTIGAVTVRGKTDLDTIDIEIVETPVGGIPVSNLGTQHDLNYDIVTTEGVKNEFIVNPTNLPVELVPYYNSSDEAIASVDSVGQVTYVADGQVDIFSGAVGWGEKRTTRIMAADADVSTGDTLSFQAGSLAIHCKNIIEGLISGKVTGDLYQKFWVANNADVNNPSAVMNANLFTGGLDFSGMSVMNSNEPDDRFAIALVTARHGITAVHVEIAIGSEIVFKRTNGTYQKVTVVGKQQITRVVSDGTKLTDVSVLYFDADVTGTTIFRTLSLTDLETYARGMTDGKILPDGKSIIYSSIPVVRKVMHNLAGGWESYLQINHLQSTQDSSYTAGANEGWGVIQNAATVLPQTVSVETYNIWGRESIAGDSGSPTFMIINTGSGNELILITTQSFAHNGPNISFWANEINEAMDALAGAPAGTWVLQHPDLTGFTSYPV